MHQPVIGEQEQFSRIGSGSIKVSLARPSHFKNFLAILKILAGLALLILSVQGMHWKDLLAGIRSANPAWLALAVSSVLLGLLLKLWRWAMLLRNYQVHSGAVRLFGAYFAGQAANIVLPLRGGELIRVGYFAGEAKLLPQVVSTIALEKYLDLLALTVCGILVSLKFSIDHILNLEGLLLPLTGFVTLFLLAVILFGSAIWRKVQIRILLPERLSDWLDGWVQASQWLRDPKQVFPGVLLTVLIWVVMWSTNLLLFRSLRLPLGATAAGLVLLSVYVGLLPALMPGNIGPFYFFARLAVLPFGILNDQAIAFAVLLHAIVTLPSLLCGAVSLLLRHARARVT